MLETLPAGMQSVLGEGGALVSGGEGQRVRLGRGLLRHQARLVILDEPFRGLDRQSRRELLIRARLWWQDATLICITHDIGHTRTFDRVVVLEQGRLAESGPPSELEGRPASRYRTLLDREAAVRRRFTDGSWQHLRLDHGQLVAEAGVGSSSHG